MMTPEQLSEHRQTHTRANSWWLGDAQRIPLCRVCPTCERQVEASYPPWVLGYGAWQGEEEVEP